MGRAQSHLHHQRIWRGVVEIDVGIGRCVAFYSQNLKLLLPDKKLSPIFVARLENNMHSPIKLLDTKAAGSTIIKELSHKCIEHRELRSERRFPFCGSVYRELPFIRLKRRCSYWNYCEEACRGVEFPIAPVRHLVQYVNKGRIRVRFTIPKSIRYLKQTWF